MQQSKYLDFLAEFGVGGAHPGGIELTKEIFKNENINRMTRVLDAGCGTGQTAAYLASTYGAKVTGMDVNPTMVAKAVNRMRSNRLPVRLVQGSIEQMPFPDQSFDIIICESVLSFVDKPKALSEIYRILRTGGRFIAIELTVNDLLEPQLEEEIKQFYGFEAFCSKKDWIDLCKQAGFENIRIKKNKSIQSAPDFQHSEDISPDLYEVMAEHYNLNLEYQNELDYRIYTSTK
ncbi:class I SAM-dependent methyltransferase [Lysinibacillus odysseyi]|uniref:Methyltransferase n=1 Tax=Lysinibacillus odysseyi 34hs-1 = NBRC 100172 TaxID=1220589 RepID=A0A0A3IIE1_9BACI|nr:class I SAM-dependent methyltransferase [Lysinibacillus odysseyi]KGR84494.1 methyltransferase [Lysinibacillus odysseyi 34hs-1 = NBRC 100172]